MLDYKAIERIRIYLEGNFKEDFEFSGEERRFEMLEFLDQVMELGELADLVATEVIFKGKLGVLAGMTQNEQ